MYRLLGKMVFDKRGRWDDELRNIDPERLSHLAACILRAYTVDGKPADKLAAGGCMEHLNSALAAVEPMPQPVTLNETCAVSSGAFASLNLID